MTAQLLPPHPSPPLHLVCRAHHRCFNLIVAVAVIAAADVVSVHVHALGCRLVGLLRVSHIPRTYLPTDYKLL